MKFALRETSDQFELLFVLSYAIHYHPIAHISCQLQQGAQNIWPQILSDMTAQAYQLQPRILFFKLIFFWRKFTSN